MEVENFRGIRKASIELGPGLNVLHGPNDLGKSTLAEAIRAALLVPTRSKEGRSYVEWDSSEPARVTMTFECSGKMWRVHKAFGYGFKSVLEQSDNIEAPRFRGVSHGGGVEGALRELLCWGVPPPGGKGAPAQPASYLVTALLGRQGAVQEILDANLAEDKDDSGKTLVTKALGALGQDPVVGRVVERLSERVDAIFTPGGKFKQSADSPLVVIQKKLQAQNERLQALQDADQRGKAIEHTVIALQGDRLQLLEEKQTAETSFAAAEERAARLTRRSSLEEVIGACKHDLERAERLDSDLSVLQQELSAAEAERDRLKVEEQTAQTAVEETRILAQAASEDVIRATAARAQSEQLADAARNQQRAELERQKSAAGARLKDVEAAERAVAELSALERELQAATDAAALAAARVTEAEQALEQSTLVATLGQLAERDAAFERLAAAYDEAQRREDEASHGASLADAALSEAMTRRDEPTDSIEITQAEAELAELRAIETHLKIRDLAEVVRELEAHEKRAHAYRDGAVAKRASASALEQEVASRVLPTPEQIASWRALEVEIGADEALPAPAAPSVSITVAVGIAAGLLVALVAKYAFGVSDGIATAVGVAIAIVVGGIVAMARRGPRTDPRAVERRTRLSERWAAEAVPALRASGLPDLSAYETALADVERRRSDAQKLRLEAENADVQAAAEARAAAPLEARRAELERLQSDASAPRPPGAASLEEFGTLSEVRLRIDTLQRRQDALRVSATEAADNAVRAATALLKERVGSSRVDLQACKLEYSIVSPK